MAYSQLEDRYLNALAELEFPTLPPEPAPAEASLEGLQLAAGPSETRTDAGPRFGRGGVTKAQSEAAGGLEKPVGAMLDMGAATVKGMTQGFLGLPGDIEALSYGVKEIFNRGAGEGALDAFLRGMQNNTILPKTEEVKAWLDKNVGTVGGGQNPYESIGEITAPGGYTKVAKGAATGLKVAGKELAPVAGQMAENYLRKTGGLMDAVPVQDYLWVAADAAGRVDNGAVKLSNKVSKGKKLQLDSKYRVSVQGAYTPQGGGQNITNDVNPGNVQEVSFRLDNLAEAFPDPLESPEKFSTMMATVYNSTEVPIPPRWLIENANDMNKWSGWFSTMSKNQIDEADRGFAVVEKFRNIYSNGTAQADTTGRLMMWAMLSRMASAYPHESGFLDLAQAMGPTINKAVRGEFTDADVAEGLRIVQQAIPQGSPGRSVISNANDFVKIFLPKMSEKLPDGRSRLQALHDMIIDQNMTGPQIRRSFYGLAENVGIKNKVLSFALLVSGREDVMVLDRIQINRLFAGGDKIYDDVANIFDGGPGLATYEALERSLTPRIAELYKRVGRGDKASVGRYHWESWVLSSGQEVAHPTLETIVKSAKGETDAFVGVPVMEGRTHQAVYGVTYERTPQGGNRFMFTASNGDQYQMNKNELDAMVKSVMKGKEKAIPKDFPGVKYFSKDTLPDGRPNPYFGKPWYTWPGVDRERIDQAAATFGTRIDAERGSRDLAGAVQGSAPDGSQRAGATGREKTSVTGGRRAPASGAQ